MSEFDLEKEEYKKLYIEDGDVLILKRRDTSWEMANSMNAYIENIYKITGKRVIMLIVDELDDLVKATDELMNKFGWYRAVELP